MEKIIYAYHRFERLVAELATLPGPARERVPEAWTSFSAAVNEDDFPEALRTEFVELRRAIEKHRKDSFFRWQNKTAAGFARRLLDLRGELRGHLVITQGLASILQDP